MDLLHSRLGHVAQTLTSRINKAITGLESVRDQLTSETGRMLQRPARSDFSFLAPHFHDFLLAQQDLIEGAGIAYEPSSLADADHWIEWWRTQVDGTPRFISHDLNRKSLRFYDYSSRDWFKKPRSLGRPMVIGPYVDMGGIDVNTVTITVPAQTSDGTHVLGCDVSLSALEEMFIKALQTLELEVLLIGSNARVITSTAPRLVTGSLADPHAHSVRSVLPLCAEDPERLPWQLVVMESQQ
ncbi:cache domain-containing protein [uncultured Citricoccus sp.]|uniref:cache domain-containing protein n=1 Tax=uncultured Citricoccus sp. TaxID=614031 RepID=UPI00260C95C5|nr:cache domain-containing protein [uncultured Citricoccus sp.]